MTAERTGVQAGESSTMTTTASDKLPKNKDIFCNTCKNETHHFCAADQYRRYPEFDNYGNFLFVETVGYRMWVCAGCETGTLEKYYIDLNDVEDATGYFPERSALHVEQKKFKQLPKQLDTIYRETLSAYNNKLHLLCAVGIRALLEGICANKGVGGSNLEKKIENMSTILPANIVSNLHSLRFIGNEAAHELSSPKLDELRLAIEISEDLLNFLYELDYKTNLLAKRQKSSSATSKAQGA
jgi:hypothetical protein